MNVCKDLSFLNERRFRDLDDSLIQEILNSCFPGIKTWLLETFKNSDHKYLFNEAQRKYKLYVYNEDNPKIKYLINWIKKIYTIYYHIYYSQQSDLDRKFVEMINKHIINKSKWEENIKEKSYNIPIINTTIYDRVKTKIKELYDITSSEKNEENDIKIKIKKKHINFLIKTINNLDKYKIGEKITESGIKHSLDSDIFSYHKKFYDKFGKYLEDEFKYEDIYSPNFITTIKYINLDNHTAYVHFIYIKTEKWNIHKAVKYFNSADRWINLEYLEVV